MSKGIKRSGVEGLTPGLNTFSTTILRLRVFCFGPGTCLPPASTPAERTGRQVIGTRSRKVNLHELVTTDALRLAVLLPDQVLPRGQMLLMESDSDLVLARVENCRKALLTLRLVRLNTLLVRPNGRFRWALQEGLWISGSGFHLVKTAPFHAETKLAAVTFFLKEAQVFKDDPLYRDESLSVDQEDAEKAKWQAVKDLHAHTVRPLEQAERDGLAESERVALLKKAACEFGVDVYARARLMLYPVDEMTPKQRKSLARRCCHIKDPVNREIALNYLKKGYNQLYPKQLAEQVFKVTGKKLSPANAKKKRSRLGLVSGKNEGRPVRSEAPHKSGT
jgi:hypothetical protein